MSKRLVAVCLLVGALALVAAGCGSSSSSSSTSSSAASSSGASASSGGGKCSVSIGFEGPITGPVAQLGGEQLHFAQLAVANANAANGTNITLQQGDTQLMPAQAVTVTQQFISNSKIVGVVGPAGSQEVTAVGPLMSRAGIGFVTGSATNSKLTDGSLPTFFRVVPPDSVQGPQDAHYIVNHLHPTKAMLVDDQTSYSTGLASSIIPVLTAAGIKVDHESVSQKVTDFSSLVSKVDAQTGVVILPWQVAANAQQFGQNLAEQHKKATIFGTDGTDSPEFKIPGSYVSNFGPDIATNPADAAIVQGVAKYGPYGAFGVPTYAATNVVAQAIGTACKGGGTPSRSSVLAAIKQTNEPTSVLGQPIKFTPKGDIVGAKFFLFKIDAKGAYKSIPST